MQQNRQLFKREYIMALNNCIPIVTSTSGQEMTKHGTPLFPVACYTDDLSKSEVSWHWHEELEAFVVEQGLACICINGGKYLIKQGEGFFINSGILHSVCQEGTSPCCLHSIVFHPRFVGGSLDSILWQKYLEPLLSNSFLPFVPFSTTQKWERDTLKAINNAWKLCAFEEDGFELKTREQLSKIILLLFQHHRASEKSPSKKALREEERIKAMLQYIQDHYSEEISLAQIADSANIGESECLRCFRNLLGLSPIQYVKQIRIQKATELLLLTNWTITDIGQKCGFLEMSYFAKTFRELKGCTPSAFRGKK